MSTPTVHNAAKKGEIAEVVLMPGDPKRAKFIAENFLTDAKLYSDVRCAYVYTGTYKGKKVSVMASGMGVGSMGIYSHELYEEYGVEKIIRVGSAGGMAPCLKLGDVVVALSASTDSGYTKHFGFFGDFAPTVSEELLCNLIEVNKEMKNNLHFGPVYTSVAFHYDMDIIKSWAKMGMMAVEMEAAALYTNAALFGKQALAMFTISDMMFTGEKMTSKERETTFTNMITTALELAIR